MFRTVKETVVGPIIRVLPVWKHSPMGERGTIVSTVSKDMPGLSPFHIGPCTTYDGLESKNMENAWQYAKVYREHVVGGTATNFDSTLHPMRYQLREEYWKWRDAGWQNPRAVRYPMGRGRKPLFSYWIDDNEKDWRLLYVAARKTIYGPLYVEAVKQTDDFKKLRETWKSIKKARGVLTLLDYDAYDHHMLKMSLTDVLNCPNRKMGHAFVLAMLLTKDPALKEMKLRS